MTAKKKGYEFRVLTKEDQYQSARNMLATVERQILELQHRPTPDNDQQKEQHEEAMSRLVERADYLADVMEANAPEDEK